MSRVWTLAILVLLLIAPHALAAEGEGSFVLHGVISLPDFAEAESSPLAVFLADTSRPDGAQVQASKVTVHRFEKRLLAATVGDYGLGQVQSGFHVDSWTLHNVTLVPRQGGNHSGYAGIYPASGARIAFAGVDDTNAQAAPFSAFGSAERADGEKPDQIHYYVRVKQPHVLLTGVGTAGYAGSGGVKISGMDVEIRASENITYHETGSRQTGPAEVTSTWLYLHFDASATVALTGPVTMATEAAALRWDGLMRFTPAEGGLRTSDALYSAHGRVAELDGNFTALLTPRGRDAEMRLHGELRGTTLALSRAPAPVVSGGASWLPLLLVGVAVVTGAAAALMLRRSGRVRPVLRAPRVPEPPATEAALARARVDADYHNVLAEVRAGVVRQSEDALRAYMRGADIAEAEGDLAAAFALMRAARVAAPHEPELALREGIYLFLLSERRKAYAAFYEAAEGLRGDPEPHLWAARCMVDVEPRVAIEHIRSALEMDASAVLYVETCEDFAPLRGRRDYEEARLLAHASMTRAERDLQDRREP